MIDGNKEKNNGILVIDDDPIQRELLKSLIDRRFDAVALLAHNGTEAKSIIESEGPRLVAILCDLNMPEFDGIEFLGYLSSSGLRCPLFIVSGAAEPIAKAAERLASGYGLDYRGFIRKPVNPAELERALIEVMPKSS